MALPLPQHMQPRGLTPGEATRRASPVGGHGKDGVGGGPSTEETTSSCRSGSFPFAAREVVFK